MEKHRSGVFGLLQALQCQENEGKGKLLKKVWVGIITMGFVYLRVRDTDDYDRGRHS